MNTLVEVVNNRHKLRQFVDFPEKLYRDCENWVPALRGDEFDTFDREKNGAYAYCDSECYLAVRDGEVVGRVAAIINRHANRDWGEETVRFGWMPWRRGARPAGVPR